MKSGTHILVVDDDEAVTSWLVDTLPEYGFVPEAALSAAEALERLKKKSFEIVISDVEMPTMRGIDLVEAIHHVKLNQLVILMTAFGTIEMALQAMRAGAADFITKPFPIESLVHVVERVRRERQIRRELVRLRQMSLDEEHANVVAHSSKMKLVLETAQKVATTSVTVLLTGESGTGKGVLARFIHAKSARANQNFIHLNCAALPTSLVEAELFGSKKGAFTDAKSDRKGLFEQAHHGTLFLDEIGEMNFDVQPKLLHVLETGGVRPVGASEEVEVDARLIAATNAPLEEALKERRFRPDLYYRLNVVRIEIPPLRERPEDLFPLVDQLLTTIARRLNRPIVGLSEKAMRWVRAYAWPGNVRELSNTLERAAALADYDIIDLEDLLPQVEQAQSPLDNAVARNLSLDDLEREYIKRVLDKTGGNKAQAARILGLDRRTLYKKAAEILKTNEGREM